MKLSRFFLFNRTNKRECFRAIFPGDTSRKAYEEDPNLLFLTGKFNKINVMERRMNTFEYFG